MNEPTNLPQVHYVTYGTSQPGILTLPNHYLPRVTNPRTTPLQLFPLHPNLNTLHPQPFSLSSLSLLSLSIPFQTNMNHLTTAASTLLLLLFLTTAGIKPSHSALVQEQPLILKYHNGALLKGIIPLNLIWYGNFSPIQRSIIVDFLNSLNSPKAPPPSAASWWSTTERYRGGGSSTIVVGKQILDQNCSLGKHLKNYQIRALASKPALEGSVNVVLTASDVTVEAFCMSRCGSHGSTRGKTRFTYAWVGNSETQCPGQCAWPFHQPIYGPQDSPLVAPNGDVGVDGMIINIATVLANTVTNPYNNGYFQGPATLPLEAASACTGVFGPGAYPGYPGRVSVDKTTGASYNAHGVNGRKYLVPAMWDPKTSACKTVI